MNGEERTCREPAPAVTGREHAPQDPPIMEQWINEIDQATSYVRVQTSKIRQHADSMFGPEPVCEERIDKGPIEEVRPYFDKISNAIMGLHKATGDLNAQIDRLEAHRLV